MRGVGYIGGLGSSIRKIFDLECGVVPGRGRRWSTWDMYRGAGVSMRAFPSSALMAAPGGGPRDGNGASGGGEA